MPRGSAKFTFGELKGYAFQTVYEAEPPYATWCLQHHTPASTGVNQRAWLTRIDNQLGRRDTGGRTSPREWIQVENDHGAEVTRRLEPL